MTDVWSELKRKNDPATKMADAAERFAILRADLNGAETELVTRFERYEQLRATLEDGGVMAQMKLSPILDAAHGAWLRDREQPRRLEISELTEAPIPPEPAA